MFFCILALVTIILLNNFYFAITKYQPIFEANSVTVNIIHYLLKC